MNSFDKKLSSTNNYPLKAEDISALQVNMGYKCNLSCTHCHVEASPDRTEEMSIETVIKIIEILAENDEITTVDITGGSPEYNPHYKLLIKSAAEMDKNIIVRSNLAILFEPEMDNIPEFW
jgi:MoaA/NifB/PqqE/SkfB family radical SAM enzyme